MGHCVTTPLEDGKQSVLLQALSIALLEHVLAGEPFDEFEEIIFDAVPPLLVARDLAVVLSGKCGAKLGSCKGIPEKFYNSY